MDIAIEIESLIVKTVRKITGMVHVQDVRKILCQIEIRPHQEADDRPAI